MGPRVFAALIGLLALCLAGGCEDGDGATPFSTGASGAGADAGEPDAEPDPGRRQGHTPIFHDPETGGLHNETLSGKRWRIASRGWVQESWPRSMKTACPDLAVPAPLPVNERQTSTVFATMMAQDPDVDP